MSEEKKYEVVTCSKCGEKKQRTLVKHLANGLPQFENEQGMSWRSGRICPQCYQKFNVERHIARREGKGK